MFVYLLAVLFDVSEKQSTLTNHVSNGSHKKIIVFIIVVVRTKGVLSIFFFNFHLLSPKVPSIPLGSTESLIYVSANPYKCYFKWGQGESEKITDYFAIKLRLGSTLNLALLYNRQLPWPLATKVMESAWLFGFRKLCNLTTVTCCSSLDILWRDLLLGVWLKQGRVEMHEVLEMANRETCHKCLTRNIKQEL